MHPGQSKLTLPARLYEMSLTLPDKEALVHLERGVRFSYRELSAEVARAARGLTAAGVEPGDHVAIWGDNAPEWLIAQWALAHLGAVWVPLDPGLEPGTAAWIMEHCQAKALVLADRLWPAAQALGPARPPVAVVWPQTGAGHGGLAWSDMMRRSREVPPGRVVQLIGRVTPADATAVMYTSGTTGRPKGVRLDHESLLAKSLAATERLSIGSNDRLALFFPLFHMFGNTCIALAGLSRGAALVMPGHAFDPAAALEALAAERCTAVFGAPGMLQAVLEAPGREEADLSALRTGIVGGARCPLELMRRLAEGLAPELAVGYGITEAASWVCLSRPQDPLERRAATVGPPLKGSEVRIADPETGEGLPAGDQGEVLCRGHLMKGYHRAPELTARVLDQEGWYHTGDLGALDGEGYLAVTGRLQEVIRRGEGRVVPAEVEEAILLLEGVAEVHVFGVPAGQGHEVAAWLRASAGAELDEEAVWAHCRASLPPELVPDEVRLVEGFPATPSGKVQKRLLAQEALARRQEG
jgi:fatty-acyl-CoA synthase